MRTGQLDTLIEIWTPAKTTLASGQEKKTFSKSVELFANVAYKTGSEGMESEQKVFTEEPTITIYDRVATITVEMLVKLNGLFYEIRSAIPDQSRFYLELSCRRKDNQNVGL